jgi:SOS response regulatory protein OraA/RecX
MKMAKKFNDFCLHEKLYIDNIAADNTILSLINQLRRENKSDLVIKTYLTSLGVNSDIITNAFFDLDSTTCLGDTEDDLYTSDNDVENY